MGMHYKRNLAFTHAMSDAIIDTAEENLEKDIDCSEAISQCCFVGDKLFRLLDFYDELEGEPGDVEFETELANRVAATVLDIIGTVSERAQKKAFDQAENAFGEMLFEESEKEGACDWDDLPEEVVKETADKLGKSVDWLKEHAKFVAIGGDGKPATKEDIAGANADQFKFVGGVRKITK